jgi:hypothetical protein
MWLTVLNFRIEFQRSVLKTRVLASQARAQSVA